MPYVTACLAESTGPIIAATDYVKAFADQVRAFMPAGRTYRVLGTDGFGRSDTRSALRCHFEVDRYFVVIAALKALADSGEIKVAKVAEASAMYGIDPEKPNPAYA